MEELVWQTFSWSRPDNFLGQVLLVLASPSTSFHMRENRDGGKNFKSMSIQTETLLCLPTWKINYSCYLCSQTCSQKGIVSWISCPTNPPAKVLTPQPWQPQNPSGREGGHLHFSPPLFEHGAELQGTARQSNSSRSRETSPCSHSHQPFLMSHTLSDWRWQKWVWAEIVRIWWFKWKTLQGRRKCSNYKKGPFHSCTLKWQ